MPQIIPIRDLKNTSQVSELVHAAKEPVFVTKNGYGDMVIMSMETFEKTMFMQDVYKKVAAAEKSVKEGKTSDAFKALDTIRGQYDV